MVSLGTGISLITVPSVQYKGRESGRTVSALALSDSQLQRASRSRRKRDALSGDEGDWSMATLATSFSETQRAETYAERRTDGASHDRQRRDMARLTARRTGSPCHTALERHGAQRVVLLGHLGVVRGAAKYDREHWMSYPHQRE